MIIGDPNPDVNVGAMNWCDVRKLFQLHHGCRVGNSLPGFHSHIGLHHVKLTLIESSVGPAASRFCRTVNEDVDRCWAALILQARLTCKERSGTSLFRIRTSTTSASLPIFVDNVYEPGPDCPTVHASRHTLSCLQSDIFNDRLWPDMVQPVDAGITVSGSRTPKAKPRSTLAATPVLLNHLVPTFGFIIADDNSAIAIVSDTSPTDRVWEVINQTQSEGGLSGSQLPERHGVAGERAT